MENVTYCKAGPADKNHVGPTQREEKMTGSCTTTAYFLQAGQSLLLLDYLANFFDYAPQVPLHAKELPATSLVNFTGSAIAFFDGGVCMAGKVSVATLPRNHDPSSVTVAAVPVLPKPLLTPSLQATLAAATCGVLLRLQRS